MARSLDFVRTWIAPLPAVEIVRTVIVSGCGLALLLAGRALPF